MSLSLSASTRIRVALAACAITLVAAIAASAAAAAPSSVTRWYGDTSSATGAALAQGACDVNGDGYDDAVVGAWFWDKAPTNNIGAAYVVLGGPEVHGGDLNTPASAGAIRIDGPNVANSFVGFSVACLGDVNGDGLDDIGVSHYTAEKIYVVLGDEEFASVDLGLLGDQGFEVQGDETDVLDYNVGFSTAPVGDVDHDGLDDFAVAGVVADTQGRTNNGRVWIVAGQDDVANVDLIAPEAGQVIMTIDGRGSEDRLGSIAPAGDVDGDGIDDLVLGAYTATPWGSGVAAPGSAWVVFGGNGGAIDLASLGTAGFPIYGPKRQRDRLGVSVSAAGDVNADGLDDVLIGGDGVYNAATGQRPGSAWVVYGEDSNRAVYTETATGQTAVYSCAGTDPGTGTCSTAADVAARGYWIQGADSDPGTGSESTGYSVSGIGDVNGDARPDFAVGAYGYDPVNPANTATTMSGAGAVWVVHGKSGNATQDLAALTAADGYRIDGLAAGDRFGRQVAGLGDVDGNGTADFAGAGDFSQRPLAPETPRTQAGEVALALLGPLATKTTLTSTATDAIDVEDEVDLTAAVATLPAPGGAPAGGTVAFTRDGAQIPGCEAVALTAGSAECAAVGFPSHGTYALGAEYSGAADRKSSAATTFRQSVTDDGAVALSPSSTSIEVGVPVTLTASVTGAGSDAPASGGSVAFRSGGSAISGCSDAAVSASGTASCETSFAAAGSVSVTAAFGGTAEVGAAESDAVSITVVEAPKPPAKVTPPAAYARRESQSPSAGRTFTLADAGCGSAACTVTAAASKLGVGKARFAVTLAGVGDLPAWSSGTVGVTLSKAAMRALRGHGKGKLRLRIDVGAPGADTASAVRRFTLRVPADRR